MKHGKEKWQAHMNRVGGSMLREETAELSQRFAQFGGATLKSKGWKRGLEDGFVTYTKTINGNRNVISQWPGFWQGDDGGTPTPELPTPSAVAAELEEYARIEAQGLSFGQFGAMASPNWTPGEHLEEALTEANPNVYNFTYGTQNTARFGSLSNPSRRPRRRRPARPRNFMTARSCRARDTRQVQRRQMVRLVRRPIEEVGRHRNRPARLLMYVVAPNAETADRRAVARFAANGKPRLSQRVVKRTCDFYLSTGRNLWIYKVGMDRPEGWNAG